MVDWGRAECDQGGAVVRQLCSYLPSAESGHCCRRHPLRPGQRTARLRRCAAMRDRGNVAPRLNAAERWSNGIPAGAGQKPNGEGFHIPNGAGVNKPAETLEFVPPKNSGEQGTRSTRNLSFSSGLFDGESAPTPQVARIPPLLRKTPQWVPRFRPMVLRLQGE